MLRPLALTVLAAVAIGQAPDRADADEAAAPADAKAEARALVQDGVALLNKKDYRGALAAFKAAHAKYASAKILLNIGTTLKALGRDAEAANAYQRYLDASDSDPARKPEIDALLADLDRKLARIALTVTPANAEIQLNLGEWMPADAARLWRLSPGSFAVKARRSGFAPAERRGDIGIGSRVEVAINLIEEPPEEDLDVEVDRPAVVKLLAAPRARSRFGAAVGAMIDPLNKGAAATVGVVVTVVERIELNAAALLGPNQGGYLGGTIYILTGTWRPTLSIGAPVFFSDGARVSARGAAGLAIVASRHLSVIAELGAELAVNPEPDIARWAVIPSIAIHGRL